MDFTITLRGNAPLLMHNDQLCDPRNPLAKEIKIINDKKKNKTDEDHLEVGRLEHFASLYLDPKFGPYIPGENIQRSLVKAGTITREGTKISRGVFISSDINPLGYKGPRDAAGLWKDTNFQLWAAVKLPGSRVMRCRPIFQGWTVQATGMLDTEILDPDSLIRIAQSAGAMIGIGDWRPRYGRFTAEVDFKS